jgi:hypothetical protein
VRETAAEADALRRENERLERELASTGATTEPYPADRATETTTTGGRHRVTR